MTFVWTAVLKASVVLVMGLLSSLLFRRRSAAFKHLILAMTIFCAALMPLAAYFLPAWKIIPSAASSVPPIFEKRQVEHPVSDTNPQPIPRQEPLTPAGIVAAIWISGWALSMGSMIAGLLRLRKIENASQPISNERWSTAAEAILRQYGVRRSVTISQSRNPAMLVTWGALRPRVLLPSGAADWPDNRLKAALYHELAHVRRFDWIIQTVSELVKSFYWFNPLLWLACNRLRLESEHSCDDMVLSHGMSSAEYARQLLDILGAIQNPDRAWSSALAMARVPTVERRFKAMLNPRIDHRSLSPLTIVFIVVLGLVVAGPLAALSSSTRVIEPSRPVLATPIAEPSTSVPKAAAASTERIAAPKPTQVVANAPKQYTGRLISINSKDADIRDIFRLIAEIAGVNLVVDPTVTGTVTIQLSNIPWDQALDVVTANQQLDYTFYRTTQGRVLRITKSGYILTNEEKAAFEKLTTDEERERFIGQFWLRRDNGSSGVTLPNFATSEPKILSDAHGYDFSPYLHNLSDILRSGWYTKIPDSAKYLKGRVVIVFTIARDGSVPEFHIATGSGNASLDLAASQSVVATLPPLPPDFNGDRIVLQFTFLYNLQ